MSGLDIILIIVFIISVIYGLVKGFIQQIFGIIGLSVGAIVASRNYYKLAQKLPIGNPTVVGIVSFLLILIGIWIAFSLIGWLIKKVVGTVGFGAIDHLLGGIIGFVVALVINGGICFAIQKFHSRGEIMIRESRVAHFVMETTNFLFKYLGKSAPTESLGKNLTKRNLAFVDFSEFPEGDIKTNCFDFEFYGCDDNPYYKHSLRLLYEGASFCCKFVVNELPNRAFLSVEHLSSYSEMCPDSGYSPVTIKINDDTVVDDFSPRSHNMVTDVWEITHLLIIGENTISLTAGELCSHYWIRKCVIFY